MSDLHFTKMVASGNDFVIIDNRKGVLEKLSLNAKELAKELCERKGSVGADGLLLIEESKTADFKMRVFNPDGSEVSMCGNGARCVALYAVEKKISGRDVKIETDAGILEAEVIGLAVKIKLTDPKGLKLNFSLKLGAKTIKANFINTGVEHIVLFVKNLDSLNVGALGSKIRYHKKFKPRGANANFVKVLDSKRIEIRTYERGVEAETLACGTGAVASAVISSLIKGLKPHIDVITKSGETLRVYFELAGKKIKDVYLEGEAKTVYEGRLTYV